MAVLLIVAAVVASVVILIIKRRSAPKKEGMLEFGPHKWGNRWNNWNRWDNRYNNRWNNRWVDPLLTDPLLTDPLLAIDPLLLTDPLLNQINPGGQTWFTPPLPTPTPVWNTPAGLTPGAMVKMRSGDGHFPNNAGRMTRVPGSYRRFVMPGRPGTVAIRDEQTGLYLTTVAASAGGSFGALRVTWAPFHPVNSMWTRVNVTASNVFTGAWSQPGGCPAGHFHLVDGAGRRLEQWAANRTMIAVPPANRAPTVHSCWQL